MRKHRQNVFERGGRIFLELYGVDWRMMSFDDSMRHTARSDKSVVALLECITSKLVAAVRFFISYIFF